MAALKGLKVESARSPFALLCSRKSSASLLCLFVISLLEHALSVSPPGYSKCDGSEWRYYPSDMGWLEAEEKCVRDGAHLATLRTERERQCFLKTASSAKGLVWIGVNDRAKEGDFRWAGNEDLIEQLNSKRWLYDQPNGNRSGHPDQDCGYTALQFKGLLGDDQCSQEHGFICQIEPEDTECNGERWTFHTEPVDWHEGNTSCREHGGYLATVNSQADRQCIRIATSKFDSGLLWVGLTDIKKEGEYVWDSDQHQEPADGPHWIPGQPENQDPDLQDCVYSRKSDGRLGDDPCSTKLPYICEFSLGDGEEGGEKAEKEEEEEEEEEFPEWGIAVIALSCFIFILAAVCIRQKRRLRQEDEEKAKDVESQRPKVQYDDPREEKEFTLKFTQGRKALPPQNAASQHRKTSVASSEKPSPYDQLRKLHRFPHSLTSILSGVNEDPYSGEFRPPGNTESDIYQQLSCLPYRHLARPNITIGKELGCGKFGKVHKGLWKQPWSSSKEVAVKTLKEESSKDDRVAFLQEAAIMGQFKHKNVVQLYGVVAADEPILLVLELMSKDLRTHLIAMSDTGRSPQSLFLSMARDVAAGMLYLSGRGFVHRDLAARNIMINKKSVCKVGDFGMSRDLADEDYYFAHGGVVPVKWAALEAITRRQYSTASDVWSYGIVLYEIITCGRKPYCFWSNQETFQQVQGGYRLVKPDTCSDQIYSLMRSCWLEDKHKRPTFQAIVEQLKTMS